MTYREQRHIRSERLAFWFLPLNGFLSIPNFIELLEGPRDSGTYSQQTGVGVLCVRFPQRAKSRGRPMPDHDFFLAERRPMVVPFRVKTERFGLNGPWTNSGLQNLQKVLTAGGFRPVDQVDGMADTRHRTGVWEDEAGLLRAQVTGAAARRRAPVAGATACAD